MDREYRIRRQIDAIPEPYTIWRGRTLEVARHLLKKCAAHDPTAQHWIESAPVQKWRREYV